MIALMNRALAKWGGKKTRNIRAFRDTKGKDSNFEFEFPVGGLILRQTMRDLPRSDVFPQTTDKHNFDHVWLTRAERDQFAPKSPTLGESWEVSESTVARIARFHTVDQVRGEANCWNRDEVKAAEIKAEVVSMEGNIATVKLSGNVSCRKKGSGKDESVQQSKSKACHFERLTASRLAEIRFQDSAIQIV